MPLPHDYKDFFADEEPRASREYWGREGAGCIFLAKNTGRILLAHRGEDVEQPGTWGTWGGKIDQGESPKDAVVREVEEETGFSGNYKIHPLYVFKDGHFRYHNFLVVVPFEFTPKLNWENDDSKWVEFGHWPQPLHFGLDELIRHSGGEIKHIIDLLKQKQANFLKENSEHFGSDAFKRWFGNSVVKGKDGMPLVVYHGTNQPFTSFNKSRRGMSTYSSTSKRGFFFTDSPDIAGAYASKAGATVRSNVSRYERKIKQLQKRVEKTERYAQLTGNWRPYEKAMEDYENFDLDSMREDDIIGQNIVPVYLKIENPLVFDFKGVPTPIGDVDKLIDKALANGNDGLILLNIVDPPPASTHYIVFKPSQVKSAIGNTGEYSSRKTNITKEGMDSSAAHQSYISKDFINYIKSVENGWKKGFRNGKWYPYASPEGGSPTIAYGHKLKSGEDYSDGISDSDAERLLIADLEHAHDVVVRTHQQWVKNYLAELQSAAKKNPSHSKYKFAMGLTPSSPIFDLTPVQNQMLIDFVFNLGSLNKFPKFTSAVFRKDWDTASKEYKRSYTDSNGHHHELGRNKIFFDTFLKPLMDKQPLSEISINYRNQDLEDIGIPKYEIKTRYSYIRYGYEADTNTYHLYSIGTPNLSDRNKGYAREQLAAFFAMIKKNGGKLHVDAYSAAGMAYIEPLIKRFSREYGVRIV